MGGSQSAPAIEYVVNEEPYPGSVGSDGLSLSQAELCNACRLGVNAKITTSNVKLKREVGAISTAECKRYADDWNRVNAKTFSVSDFLGKLQAGRYSKLVSDSKSEGDQYCQELSITDTDAAAMRESGSLDPAKFKGGRIRKVSGSSFSEETKAKFIPSIPFQMSFTAKKAAVGPSGRIQYRDVSDAFTVTQMTLYHPSPIRIDSVQADAVLSLNDPTDKAAKYIVLIPLRSVNSGNPSNTFFNTIVRNLFSIKEQRPDTGEYEETTIPTGSDWALDKLFTLTAGEGSTTVKNGFFTWTGVGGYERVNKGTARSGNKFITTIGWKQAEGLAQPQYILLDTPLDINTEDMSTLTQTLPVTPPADAIHIVPAHSSLVYHKPSSPPAPDSMSGRSGCGANPILSTCEGFEIGSNSPDPFVRNAAKARDEPGVFTPQRIFALVLQIILVVFMIAGAYLAVRMITEGYDITVRNYAEKIGRVLAVWVKGVSEKISAARSLMSSGSSLLQGNATGVLDNLTTSLKGKGEGALGDLASSLKGKGEGALGNLATSLTGKAEGALGNATNALTPSIGKLLNKRPA
jgi:hypothetical protein